MVRGEWQSGGKVRTKKSFSGKSRTSERMAVMRTPGDVMPVLTSEQNS